MFDALCDVLHLCIYCSNRCVYFVSRMRSSVDDPFPLRCVRGSVVVRLVLIHYMFGDEGIRRGERMAAHYGRLIEFDRGVEEWVTYIERLEQYFAANEIEDNGKKRAI